MAKNGFSYSKLINFLINYWFIIKNCWRSENDFKKKKIKSGKKREQDERRENKNTEVKEKVDNLQEMWVLG